MLSVLFLGLMMGMRHAVESDHVAAVAALAADPAPGGHMVKLGTLWGAGHALTLFGAGILFMVFDWARPEQFSVWLELAVGVMLVLLGADLLRRIAVRHIHFHIHEHGATRRHFHAHVHSKVHSKTLMQTKAHEAPHPHHHRGGLSVRAFVVGMVHGMAGSAALVVLVLGTIQSLWVGMAYLAIFAVGSIMGMAAFSMAISLPLSLSAQTLSRALGGLQGVVGVWTLGLGFSISYGIISALA